MSTKKSSIETAFSWEKIAEFGVFRLYPQADYLGTQLREKRMLKQVTDFFKYFFFIFKQW